MSQKLSNYTIQGEIGRGGMAVVYRAVQESLNRVVAIKELDLSRLRSEPNALDRFRLEAQAAAALDHPGIVTIYDLWEEEGKAYIAMEFIDGVELKDVLLSLGSIQYMNAVLIGMAISEALHYAHQRGMIHRDVKPGNIMLSGSGEIRLTDFGIVSVAGAGDLTVAGQILGTPAYMSPEQIAGEEVGPGADLFSLGAVLYEMIAGKKPFTGANHIALIQDVLHSDPVPLHELDPQIPESISLAVQKCLEKSPERRYGSMEELVTVLEMVMPLEIPTRAAAVTRLVEGTREQERTRLHTSASEEDRTSPAVVQSGASDSAAAPTELAGSQNAHSTSRTGAQTPLIQDSGSSLYDLEEGPPADLPPLEPDEEMTGSFKIEPLSKESAQTPLTLKEISEPEIAEDEVQPMQKTRRNGSKMSVLWILLFILIAAGVVWKFAGGSKQAERLINTVNPVVNTQITVVADPAGEVFMDGQLIGNAEPNLVIDAKPGLHTLEVRHPGFGPRKFIVELDSGGMKEIEVKFRDP